MILKATSDTIAHCAHLLQQDEIIGIPTETVYGLAGNALKERCVRKIFQVKNRPLIDPLIVHCKDLRAVEALTISNYRVRELAEAFWPGPLTLVVPKNKKIPDIVTAGLPSVAVRIPSHPILRTILERIDFPLAAPSANPFGYVSPTLAIHVEQTLGHKIKAILDGGPCDIGLESTIIDVRVPEKPVILRQGPITAAQINHRLRIQIETRSKNENQEHDAQTSPGLLTRHYSPKATVELLEHGSLQHKDPGSSALNAKTALVCNQKPDWYTGQANIYWLSANGDLDEMAHNLFHLLQSLDRQGFQKISIEQVPAKGLGLAINDRIKRAAAKTL